MEEKAKFYGDFEFLKVNNYQNYCKYVNSLDANNLKKEWHISFARRRAEQSNA